MAKSEKISRFGFLKKNFLPITLSILLVILSLVAYREILKDKYYPFTFAGDTNISFLTEGQAIRAVQSNFERRSKQKIEFASFTIDLATASAALDYSTLGENLVISHQNPSTFFTYSTILPEVTLSLDKQLDNIANAVYREPQNAQLVFDEMPASPTHRGEPGPEGTPAARIQIKEAIDGIGLDKDQTLQEVKNFLLTGKYQAQLPLKIIPPKITTGRIAQAKAALETTVNEPIKLTFNEKNWILDAKQLLTLLNLTKAEDSLLDKDQTTIYLKSVAAKTDQDVQEGLFEFNPQTRRVTAFKPSQEGRKLNIDQAFNLISESLASQGVPLEAKTISLPVEVIKPKIATSDVNSLGIQELLGRGVSNFAGSIANRIYSISLTASRINGVLVPPGQIFSFNQTVGDISAATGFKQAYVIKEGRTVLDDGGGVCQDSTTLFRAVLNAGLPIVKRTAHAYRVSYYEQGFPPGLDATVFYPSVDFQFKNDTANYILIQAYTSGVTLYVDLYGTPDGRVTTLTTPVVTNQIPPPPELRQDDPTLPKGTIKQVDWAAWGANVSFKRTVTKNGETLINETWKSNYKPWQAVYLVGTQ